MASRKNSLELIELSSIDKMKNPCGMLTCYWCFAFLFRCCTASFAFSMFIHGNDSKYDFSVRIQVLHHMVICTGFYVIREVIPRARIFFFPRTLAIYTVRSLSPAKTDLTGLSLNFPVGTFTITLNVYFPFELFERSDRSNRVNGKRT